MSNLTEREGDPKRELDEPGNGHRRQNKKPIAFNASSTPPLGNGVRQQ